MSMTMRLPLSQLALSRLVHGLVILALALPLVIAAPANSGAMRVQPLLLTLAEQQPEALVRIIVQKTAGSLGVEDQITALGGTVLRELRLIEAVNVKLPAAQALKVAQLPGVKWVSLDAMVHASDAPAGVFREDFDLGVIALEAPTVWPSGWAWSQQAWTELGEADGPIAGDVAVTSFLGGNYQGLRLQGAGRGLLGAADLSASAGATLTLAYRRYQFADGDAVRVEVSADGGATWAEAATWAGAGTDDALQTFTLDLAAYRTASFALRFLTAETFSAEARLYVDFAQIEYASVYEQPAEARPGAMAHQLFLPLVQATPAAAAAGAVQPEVYANSLFLIDYFNSVNYSLNNGTKNWAAAWTESDTAGAGAAAGNVNIYAGELWLDDYPNTNTTPWIARKANLTGASFASLTFNFRTSPGVDASDQIAVEVSANGGTTYTTIEIIDGITGEWWDWRYYDISPFISASTMVRFRVLTDYGVSDEYFVIDNVELEYNTACVQCIDTSLMVGNYPKAVRADQVWNGTSRLQGQGITVAVVDSGISWHPDLYGDVYGRILASMDFTDGYSWDDLNGHGTYVAGVIGGDGVFSNRKIMGVAPRVNLLDVKVSDDFGRGNMSDVVAGLQWVYDTRLLYNTRVANLSLNSSVAESYHNSPLNAALEILWFNGIVVVVSAGNNGSTAAGVLYPPANDPFVITVGAVDHKQTISLADDVVPTFSAYGVTPQGHAKPDLVAPGKFIISLLSSETSNLAQEHPLNRYASDFGLHYFFMSGTSVSAPMVAGAAALLLQDEPGLNPDQVKYRLKATANKSWAGYSSAKAGAGTLDVYAAITGTSTQAANTGLAASQLLWTGSTPVTWSSVSWSSVSWSSVSWSSVSWSSVSWSSVSWSSDHWGP